MSRKNKNYCKNYHGHKKIIYNVILITNINIYCDRESLNILNEWLVIYKTTHHKMVRQRRAYFIISVKPLMTIM